MDISLWVDALLPFALAAALYYFAARRLKRYLQFFQQEEYDGRRFLAWLWQMRAFDKRGLLLLLLFGLIYHLLLRTITPDDLSSGIVTALVWVPYAILTIGFLLLAMIEKPEAQQKKPLVWTARVKRIYGTALAVILLPAFALGWPLPIAWLAGVLPGHPLHLFAIAAALQLLPLVLPFANLLLKPYEFFVQRRLRLEAQRKLAALNPTVIGITGSFGKTSVKHILAHILASVAPTLATPGSVNTLMGITRIIREQLQPSHRFFLVEMGAYRPGSVAKLCRFTPPQYGILTAIGAAHYERFKSLDQVARAKFELGEAVWKNGGKLLVNTTQIDQDFLARRQNGAMITVGTGATDRYRFSDVVQTPNGLALTLHLPDGEPLQLTTPLFGLQHAANLALAAALAIELGVPPSMVALSLRAVPQTKHRLEVKRFAGGPTIIDDAYNSNPAGFTAALEVLDLLGTTNKGRRILITPGMTELGSLHTDEHRRLGALAAAKVDWIIAVRPERIEAFIEGVQNTGNSLRLDRVPTLAAARALLNDLTEADVVLYENDLPELYESRPRF